MLQMAGRILRNLESVLQGTSAARSVYRLSMKLPQLSVLMRIVRSIQITFKQSLITLHIIQAFKLVM